MQLHSFHIVSHIFAFEQQLFHPLSLPCGIRGHNGQILAPSLQSLWVTAWAERSCWQASCPPLVTACIWPCLQGSPKPALQSFFQELRNTESIGTVLFIIRDYFSFFNYRVIKHIVDLVQTRIKLCFTSKCLASLLSGGRVLAAYLPGTLICATGDISTFQWTGEYPGSRGCYQTDLWRLPVCYQG